jgi:predicted transcriptional regulator
VENTFLLIINDTVRPGELQELHELQTLKNIFNGTCDFIQSMLEQEDFVFRMMWQTNVPVSRVVASLRVVKGENVIQPAALLLKCAATLTELECYQLTDSAIRVLRDARGSNL